MPLPLLRPVALGVLTAMLLVLPRTAAGRLALDRLRPYLDRGVGLRARRALETGDQEEAIKLLRRYLRPPRGQHHLQAQFLLGRALLDRGEVQEAAQLFARLERTYPLLRDYHRYYRARALYRGGEVTRAAAVARRVDKRSVLYTDAQLLRADALQALGRLDEDAKLWRRYLKQHPDGQRRAEAHFRIAAALEKTAGANEQRLRQALQHYKMVGVVAPLGGRRSTAESRAKALAARLKEGKKLLQLDASERYTQARVYYRAMRNKQAEQAFAAVLQDGALDDERRCRAAYYRAKSVYKARQRERSMPLFAEAARHCRRAGLTDLLVKSRYNQGRGLFYGHKYEASIQHFLALEKDFGQHSYADDARLRAAEAAVELGDDGRVRRLLEEIPTRYPRGDMAREALWRLARQAYLSGDLDLARGHLDRALKMGRAQHYYAEGQALYWKARILDRQNRRREAAELYERCIREYPLSYYSLQSFNRLREHHGRRYRRLHAELIRPIGRKAGRWRFDVRHWQRNRHFQRGVELALLGLGSHAARELHRAGLRANSKTSQSDLWLAAVLYHRAGLWHLSHNVPRRLDSRYKTSYPHGDNFRRWTISYPRAFAVHVRREARHNGLTTALIRAVMREESGFSPRIESYANAVGLMQMILPTARAAAAVAGLGRVPGRTLLRDPAVNIRLGACYLGWLYRAFRRTAPLAIAGYNAGQGAVYRWLPRFAGATLDEFVEQIPYDQTRHYTKRVLATYFVYSALYQHRIPTIGQRLPQVKPQAFVPKKKKRRRKRRRRGRRGRRR